MTVEDCARLLRDMEERSKGRGLRWRNYLLVAVIVNTGLRAHELGLLRVEDLRSGSREPFLVLHGGKMRRAAEESEVPLRPGLAAKLRDFVRGRPAGSPIFWSSANQRATPVTRRQVWRIVKRAVLDAGLDPRFTAHSLRHVFVTAVAGSAKNSPADVKHLGRFRSWSTVDRYIHTTRARQARALREADLPL